MGILSDIYQLRPIIFNYKTDIKKKRHYGLIAEEVLEVNSDLTIINKTINKIETVAYHYLPSMLLNEMIKLNKRLDRINKGIEIIIDII